MKKNIFFTLGILSCAVGLAHAELSLSSTNINNYKSQGYILSDNVNTYGECENLVKKYNTEYPSYKRSECFKDSEGYKYFICQTTQSCELAGGTSVSSSATSSSTTSTNATSSTTSTSTVSNTTTSTPTTSSSLPNKDKLDKFMEKVESLEKTMTPERYEATLKAVSEKLAKLSTKYANNPTVSSMTAYLKSSVEALISSLQEAKKQKEQESEVDTFFCELADTCSDSTPVTQETSSSGTTLNQTVSGTGTQSTSQSGQ